MPVIDIGELEQQIEQLKKDIKELIKKRKADKSLFKTALKTENQLKNVKPVAISRKEYTCEFCGEFLPKGSSYCAKTLKGFNFQQRSVRVRVAKVCNNCLITTANDQIEELTRIKQSLLLAPNGK